MSGKILIGWKHRLCSEISRQRYLDPDITRSTHIEIANIFFNQEQDDSDEISSEHNSEWSKNWNKKKNENLLTDTKQCFEWLNEWVLMDFYPEIKIRLSQEEKRKPYQKQIIE